MPSSSNNLPLRMYRNNRPVDMNFDDNEKLYNRCQEEHICEGRILPQAIRFPDWSVNREKYSEPEDVLLPDYLDWGIIQFQVGDIPTPLSSTGDVVFDFKVEHDPTENNYSHSEIRTYKSGLHTKKLKINDIVKKTFRQLLSEKSTVIKQPSNITINQ